MGKLHPTNIQWCTHTVNPIVAVDRETGKRGWACTKVATGCMNCYAEALNVGRFGTGHPFDVKSDAKVEWRLDEAALQSVLRRRKPATIFWCDMTDLFHERVPDEWIDRCFAVMALTPHLRHIVLTKRPERMNQWYRTTSEPNIKRGLSNVAAGTSIACQRDAEDMLPWALDELPIALRFISLEPQVESVDLENVDFRSFYERLGSLKPRTPNDPMLIFDALRGHMKGPDDMGLPKLDVIIIGGESGPKARPFDLAWARSTIAQCEAAGVVTMVKQLGFRAFEERGGIMWPRRARDGHGGDPSEWPEDLRSYAASPERWPRTTV